MWQHSASTASPEAVKPSKVEAYLAPVRWARRFEAGITLIELTIAGALSLIVAIAVYDFFDASNRSFVREQDLANAQNTGRVALDIFAGEVRTAGYSPIGLPFYAVQYGDPERIRVAADLDGDGLIGTASEEDELVAYEFVGPDGDGIYTLQRGIDLDEDWDFTDSDEYVQLLAPNVVAIDFDEDGTVEPFLAYSSPAPTVSLAYDHAANVTSLVTITFGIRAQHIDRMKKEYPVVKFQTDLNIRNR